MDFQEWMEHVVRGFEIVGVVCLVLGSVWGLAAAVPAALRGDVTAAYARARQLIGRSILLGLEILIVADIVQTITIDASLESAATLGLIVLVRTFLSFSLEVELEGVVPWRRSTVREAAVPTSPVSRH